MYAQLCSRLHTYNPNSDINKDKQNTVFIRVLVKKCQEEFDNRAKATAVFEKKDGLTAEELEQREVSKRKMLGNIKFIGELFKLGMLHESIMHQCIKELLEKKKNQQILDTTENIECLCNLLRTVGKKLDVEKAQGWMNQYFKRMAAMASNEELPPRYRFMLQNTIELRSNQWIPRRATNNTGPKTIHEIREESIALQNVSRGSPNMPPHYFMPRPGPPFVPNPPPPGAVSANYISMHGPPPGHMGYFPPPPQPRFGPPHGIIMNHHGGVVSSADEGFLHPPPGNKDRPLLHPKELGLDDQVHHPNIVTPLSNNSTPPVQKNAMQQSPGGSSETPEKKQVKKLQPIKRDENVSLRPSTAPMKGGSGKKQKQQQQLAQPPLDKVVPQSNSKEEFQKILDSSDDEESHGPRKASLDMLPPMGTPPLFHGPHPPPRFAGAPMEMYHPNGPNPPPPGYCGPAGQSFGRVPPPPAPNNYFNQPAVCHMRPPLPPHSNQFPHYQPPPVSMAMPPPRPYGPPPPPGQQGTQVLPSQGGPPPPAVHPSARMPPPLVPAGDQFYRQSQPIPPQPPGAPVYHSQPRPHGWAGPVMMRPPSENLPPHLSNTNPLDRTQPLPMKYVSAKSGKKGSSSGHGSSSKSSMKDQEKILESIVSKYLTTLDRKSSVVEIYRLDGINGKDICLVLMKKFLGKSEDDRVYISELMYDLLASRKENARSSFIEAFKEVLRSIGDYQSIYSQCKAYIAGFAARAIAKDMISISDIAPLFAKGSHHPTMLTILQALLILIGEDALVSQFKECKLHLATFLPTSVQGHHSIVELLETQYKTLEFLYPLRKIEKELITRLKQEKSAPPIYKWIKTNVDSSYYPTSDFVMVLTTCILDHVSCSTWLREDLTSDQTPSKQALENEERLIGTFKVLVQKFVHDSIPLQISAIYATQLFCHKHHFPKGLLLRLFSYWYDLDVIEEDAFLKWKEDISHNFPGKGKALFQVNQWLVWLAEPDEESEEDEP